MTTFLMSLMVCLFFFFSETSRSLTPTAYQTPLTKAFHKLQQQTRRNSVIRYPYANHRAAYQTQAPFSNRETTPNQQANYRFLEQFIFGSPKLRNFNFCSMFCCKIKYFINGLQPAPALFPKFISVYLRNRLPVLKICMGASPLVVVPCSISNGNTNFTCL